MGKYFDQHFISYLEIGDMEGAIALLIKQYPHLRNDKDRQALYINKYKACYLDNLTTTPVQRPPKS